MRWCPKIDKYQVCIHLHLKTDHLSTTVSQDKFGCDASQQCCSLILILSIIVCVILLCFGVIALMKMVRMLTRESPIEIEYMNKACMSLHDDDAVDDRDGDEKSPVEILPIYRPGVEILAGSAQRRRCLSFRGHREPIGDDDVHDGNDDHYENIDENEMSTK